MYWQDIPIGEAAQGADEVATIAELKLDELTGNKMCA
jgi:hypothetical protein